jgi:hypothetical protein
MWIDQRVDETSRNATAMNEVKKSKTALLPEHFLVCE